MRCRRLPSRWETKRARTRLLSLTGLDPDDLRQRAAEPEVLVAVLRFLEDHEPDLLAVADTLGMKPQELVAARIALDA